MKVLIIEDEIPAAEKLERYLMRYDPDTEVVDKLNSVKAAANLWKPVFCSVRTPSIMSTTTWAGLSTRKRPKNW